MRYLIFLFLLFLGGPLAAQPLTRPCYNIPGQLNCQTISAATPLHYHVVYGNGTNLVLVRG